MRVALILLFIIALIAGCKKDRGKHCPDLPPQEFPRADLSAVSHIPEIMDTLAKYPELKPIEANVWYSVTPGAYTARITCLLYYKGIPLNNGWYYLLYSNYDDRSWDSENIPRGLNLSVDASIGLEQAKELAEEKVHFEHCQMAQIHIYNRSRDTIPDYKLVWRVSDPMAGIPFVIFDAHTGETYEGYSTRGTPVQ